MNFSHQTCRKLRFSSLLIVAMASGFASSTYGQRTVSPFALPPQGFQSSISAQMPQALPVRQMQARPAAKRMATELQLNQALIAEAYRRSAAYVAGLLAQGAEPNAFDKARVLILFYAVAVKGNMPVVMLLLGKGVHVNAWDPRGNTVLAEAAPPAAGPVGTGVVVGRRSQGSDVFLLRPKSDLRNTGVSDHTCCPERTLQDRRHLRRA